MPLSDIGSPQDLKPLSIKELKALADEARARIIEVMSKNGGHLGSNLGAVELSIALHKVFDSPKDKFIWDVSHQTYTHKLLTGRQEKFDRIRKYKGLCGFSHPKESKHDHFQAGHAGTALSLALGVAKSRDLNHGEESIIPIIGDATLTCGMSLEALNNIPRQLKKFMVILNDNKMSISENVGAITGILSRFLSNPTSNRFYHNVDQIVSKIPAVGPVLSKQGHKLAESMKHLVSPAAFFEQYNVSYVGPIDGHNLEEMIEVFEGLKETPYPVIVHVITKKGQGMDIAIENPTSYHGAKPFDLDTGKFLPQPSSKPTFPKVFGKHIIEMAEKDPEIVAVTPAMLAGSCLDDFIRKFPDRCLDVGIAESHTVTFAGGMAHGNKTKVLVSIYATFLQRAFDNLFHDVCLQEMPVVFAIDRAGLSPADGSTHHGVYDIAFLNAMPNMVICQPRDGTVLKELLNVAFSWKRPTAIRYPNMDAEENESPKQIRKLGRGEILKKGEGILILGLGHMCQMALQVRELLKEKGINATVLDPVFVKPLDKDLLTELLMTHHTIVTIEEHSVQSGLGAIVNHYLMTHKHQGIETLNFGIPEAFIEQGSHKELMQEMGLTPEKIAEEILIQVSPKKAEIMETSA
ncbi:MAG: 1-deoxy-D-xylulose-5-phosphate synthase [Chlamydiia bacterium]|nr:1-deoxy-D-xylulose-5-phosphate synthase [Chlamydiia bacterium]